MENIDYIMEPAGKNFNGQINSYVTYFFGICEDCLKN